MKKTVAAAIAAAVVVGTSSTSFAALNPFSDVPTDHWAYEAVGSLIQSGIIDYYSNSEDTFLNGKFVGERQITRYEVAQLVAKALARTDEKFDRTAQSLDNGQSFDRPDRNYHATKADLENLRRLVEEFRPELERLGVLEERVNEMWKYQDKVIWQGKIEYTYKSHRTDNVYNKGKTKVNQDDWIFRFEPIAVVNSKIDPNEDSYLSNPNLKINDTTYKSLWTLRARIDAHTDLSRNQSGSFTLERGWAQGDYKNFQVKVGKQPLYTNEDGIVWDTEYSGAEITFGKLSNGLRATIYGGRLAPGTVVGARRNAGSWNGRRDGVSADDRWNAATGRLGRDGNDPSSFWAINVQYDPGAKGLFAGAGYYSIKDDDLRNYVDGAGVMHRTYSNSGDTNKAKIWSVNAGYRLGKAQLWGAYASNTEADIEKSSWQALFKYGDLYGGGNQGTHKGQWAVWAGYKKLGSNASLCAINWDDAYAGTKGFVAGASFAPMDRVVFLAKYFKGKYIEGSRKDAERLFGRVEFFF